MSKPFYFPVFYILNLSVATASTILSKNIPAPTASFPDLLHIYFDFPGFRQPLTLCPLKQLFFHHTTAKCSASEYSSNICFWSLLKHGITLQLRSFILRLHARSVPFCDDLTCDRPPAHWQQPHFQVSPRLCREVLRPSEEIRGSAHLTPTSGSLVVTAVDIQDLSSPALASR